MLNSSLQTEKVTAQQVGSTSASSLPVKETGRHMLLAKKGSSHDPDCVLTSVPLGKDPSSATTTTSVVEKSREERDNLDRGFPDKKVTCAGFRLASSTQCQHQKDAQGQHPAKEVPTAQGEQMERLEAHPTAEPPRLDRL